MKTEYEEMEEALDRVIIQNEAFRLGSMPGNSDPDACVEMRMLMDAVAPEDRPELLRWYGLGLVVSA